MAYLDDFMKVKPYLYLCNMIISKANESELRNIGLNGPNFSLMYFLQKFCGTIHLIEDDSRNGLWCGFGDSYVARH